MREMIEEYMVPINDSSIHDNKTVSLVRRDYDDTLRRLQTIEECVFFVKPLQKRLEEAMTAKMAGKPPPDTTMKPRILSRTKFTEIKEKM